MAIVNIQFSEDWETISLDFGVKLNFLKAGYAQETPSHDHCVNLFP